MKMFDFVHPTRSVDNPKGMKFRKTFFGGQQISLKRTVDQNFFPRAVKKMARGQWNIPRKA